MNVEIKRHVEVTSKTPRGSAVEVVGSTGMVRLQVGKATFHIYTDEIESLAACLAAFQKAIAEEKQ